MAKIKTQWNSVYSVVNPENTNKTIQTMENKNIWGKILNILITVLTAIATTFGVTSCIGN